MGKVQIQQPPTPPFLHDQIYISTGNNTNLTAVVHDPNFFIRNHTLDVEFYWMINQRVSPMQIGMCVMFFSYNIHTGLRYK